MRYRLGSFLAHPGSSDFERYLTHPQLGPALRVAHEEMLEVRLSAPGDSPNPPDLLDELGEFHRDRPWVEAVDDVLIQCSRTLEPRLLACDYEPGPEGFLTVAACVPSLEIEVFEDDRMQIGFAAMRNGLGQVRAWPRLLREVCMNGSLVSCADFDSHEGLAGIEDATARFLTIEYYKLAVALLREARATAVEDPREYFDEMMRSMRLIGHRETVATLFNSQQDRSLYGLFNAITATARDIDDWRDRFDLEELAGQLVRLRRPVPSRSGSGALLLP
jgi:hypothetical protein